MFKSITKWFKDDEIVKDTETGTPSFIPITSVTKAYNDDPVVGQCVNMLIDSSAAVRFDVKLPKKVRFANSGKLSIEKISELLNDRPNPDMSRDQFMRVSIQDLLFTGFSVIYHDSKGNFLYPLKSQYVKLVPGTMKLIDHIEYNNTSYPTSECIVIVDNGFKNVNTYLTGNSRICSILKSVNSKLETIGYEDYVMKSRAVVTLAIETDAVLSKKLKKRFQDETRLDYNPKTGRSSVLILDSGAKLKEIRSSLKDQGTIEVKDSHNKQIALGLGVPYSVLTPTPSANVDADIKQFYKVTVANLMNKFKSSFEFHFGMDVSLDYSDISILQNDIKKQSDAVATKVNNGLITTNEGREELRYEPLAATQVEGDFDPDKLRTPANIAGSASNPLLGGRPEEDKE